MNGLVIAAALLVASIADIAIVPQLAVHGARPALAIAVVAYAALTRRAGWGMFAGLLGGLLIDALAPGRFGAHAAAGVVLGFLLGNLWGAVYRDRWPAQAVSLLGAVLVTDAAAWLLGGAHASDDLLGLLLRRSLPSGIYTALVGPVLFAVAVRGLHLRVTWDSAPTRAR